MTINEAARLIAVPTHTVEYAVLNEAAERLKAAGMHNLHAQLTRRIITDPRTRGLQHGKLLNTGNKE